MKTQEELNTIKEELKTLTGKLSELSEDELNQVVGGTVKLSSEDKTTTDVLKALQERVAGVQCSTDDQSSQAATIRIRGIGSLNASNSPLYVVDGTPDSES